MTLEDAPSVLTVDEAAELLRVDRKTVYRAIDAGDLPVLRLGRTIRISKQTLVNALEPEEALDDRPHLQRIPS